MFHKIQDQSIKSTLNEIVQSVIDKELSELSTNTGFNLGSVDKLNEKFLAQNHSSYESLIEGAKVVYLLNPDQNQTKALDIVTNVQNSKLNIQVFLFHVSNSIHLMVKTFNHFFYILLKHAMQTYSLITETETFGKVDAQVVDSFRTKLKQLYPHAILFKTHEEQEAELTACVKNLSLNVTINTSGDLNEKLSNLNIK